MSKATHQRADRREDKQSSQKPASRRPGPQIQICVRGLPVHFARSGRDGRATHILSGLGVRREVGTQFGFPLSSLKKILAHGAGKYRPFAKRSAIIRAWSEFQIPGRPFCATASVGRGLPVGPLKSAAPTLPGQQSKTFYEGAKKYAPVRSFIPDDPAMTNDPKPLQAVLRKISQNSERSSLFWWMVENHRRLKAEAQGRRLRWEPLCIVFAEHGLTDVNGQPPKPNTARQTWLRARRFVAEQEQRSAAGKRPWSTYPSHFPKDFRPAAFELPEQGVPARPPHATSPDTRDGKQLGRPSPAAASPKAGADTLRDALSALDKTDGYLKSL